MPPSVIYEVWARRPARKADKKAPPLRHQEFYPERGWQFAVKKARRLVERGFTDVVVREVTVTHEQRVERPGKKGKP